MDIVHVKFFSGVFSAPQAESSRSAAMRMMNMYFFILIILRE